MFIDNEFDELWDPWDLPERIKGGDFTVYDWEKEVILNHIHGFFDYIKELGHVPLRDFANFLEFLDTLGETGDPGLTEFVTEAMILTAQMRTALEKEEQQDLTE